MPSDRAHLKDVDRSESGRTWRILVVDDNIDAADSLAKLLQAQGPAVNVAYDGIAAMEVAGEHKPGDCFSRIGMPGMDGYELAAAFRRTPVLEASFLVALTGWGAEEDRAKSRRAGFDRHLTKPASPTVLSRLIEELQGFEERRLEI